MIRGETRYLPSKKDGVGIFMSDKMSKKETIKLILRLAKNDFKARFAGSYLGIVWAFAQPIVTILVYWFVFEKGFKPAAITTKEGLDIPFVLFLVGGMVPWFYFSEALSSATNTLLEYSYLVKKVVFRIDILPLVKMMSAYIIHFILLLFTLLLFCCMGYFPSFYILQIVYYDIAMVLLVLGISYGTCAIVVFFRDLSQIIGILLQVGVWITPIMWNMETMDISPTLKLIFKLNPMYYIVTGYRDALYKNEGFWTHPELTLYFWVVTLALFFLGRLIFKRLKVHFADVL